MSVADRLDVCAITDWINERIRQAVAAEREACALVAMKEGYPQWDDDVPQRHRDSWEHCANVIAIAIRSRTEGTE